MRIAAAGERLAFIPPMLPTLVDEPPEGSDWIHEIKYDGWRCQIVIDAQGTRVFTRNGHDWTTKLQPIADAAAELPAHTAVIDGELILPGSMGKPDFGGLKTAIAATPGRLVFVAFDLLYWNRKDFRDRPVLDRRRALWSLVEPAKGRIQYSDEHDGSGAEFFTAVDEMGLEGIVSKRAGSRYRSGRTREWLKVKAYAIDTFEIAGVLREPGEAALALMTTIGPERRYVGSAIIALKGRMRERLWKRVEAARGTPLPGVAKAKAQWIAPGMTGRVRFLRGEEKLRHATLTDISE